MLEKIHKEIDALYQEMVDIRRYLHRYPELSFKETETPKFIANYYEELGIPYQDNVGGNGVVATLKGGKPGKTICLRADFDALPIQEENDVPYKSTVDGVMHACGHDGHTAQLLALAKAVQPFQEELTGTIVFLHQHAEEYAPGGAKPMIESGVLDGVDAVFGTHLWTPTPFGALQTSTSAFMAGADRFTITIQGKGGHGGYPHQTKDALVIGAGLINDLQQIVARRLDPLKTAVITVGKFTGGSAFNIIADTAELIGTVRYFDPELQEQIKTEIEKTIQGACTASDASYEFHYETGYPPLINHKDEANLVMEVGNQLPEVVTSETVEPVMAGEDFAYYMQERPGAFFFTGAHKKENPYPHHHPKFDIEEKAMPIAAKTLIGAYLSYQDQQQK